MRKSAFDDIVLLFKAQFDGYALPIVIITQSTSDLFKRDDIIDCLIIRSMMVDNPSVL